MADKARDLALNHGSARPGRTAHSKDGEVLGTFCLSYAEPRIPNNRDLELIQAAAHVALIAIELERSRLALKNAVVELGTQKTNCEPSSTRFWVCVYLVLRARSSLSIVKS